MGKGELPPEWMAGFTAVELWWPWDDSPTPSDLPHQLLLSPQHPSGPFRKEFGFSRRTPPASS